MIVGRSAKGQEPSGHEDLAAKLQQPVGLRFGDESLAETLDQLAAVYDVAIRFDVGDTDLKTLQVVGFLRDAPLRRVLRSILSPYDLYFAAEKDGIVILSKDRAEDYMTSVNHPVGDLLLEGTFEGLDTRTPETLAKLIQHVVSPASWSKAGVTIQPVGTGSETSLRVRNSVVVQHQIEDFFERLRYALRSPDSRWPGLLPDEAQTADALDSFTCCKFVETPLSDAVHLLTARRRVQTVIDSQAASWATHSVTLSLKDVTLRAALQSVLRPDRLAFTNTNGVVRVILQEQIDDFPVLRVYSLDRLFAVALRADQLDPGAVTKTILRIVDDHERGRTANITLTGHRLLVVSLPVAAQGETADLLLRLEQVERQKAEGKESSKLTPGTVAEVSARKKIEEALRSPTQLEFIETPLGDVADYLGDRHRTAILIDRQALHERDIGTDTPITKNLKGISLRSGLRLMLVELNLTYTIRDKSLWITTFEEAESWLRVEVYPVDDLVGKGVDRLSSDCESFVDFLMQAYPWPAADDAGPDLYMAASPAGLTPSVIARCSDETHKQITSIIAKVRAVADSKPGDLAREPYPPAEKEILDALNRPTNLKAKDTPLQDVLDELATLNHILIMLDKKALDDVDVGSGSPVTIEVHGIPLREALTRVLDRWGLTYLVRDEVVLVTTPEVEEAERYTEVYPIDPEVEERLGEGGLRGDARVKEIIHRGEHFDVNVWPLGPRKALAVSLCYQDHEALAARLGVRPIPFRESADKPEKQ
jgi:hypothetical protein